MDTKTVPQNVKKFAMFLLGICIGCVLCSRVHMIQSGLINTGYIWPEISSSSKLPDYSPDSNLSTVNRTWKTLSSPVPELASAHVDVFVPVHTPKFPFMISFHKSLSQCKFARDQMKLVLVFSTTLESLDYERLVNTTCPVCTVGYSVLVTPEWTGQGLADSIPGFKKMFGPALTLDVGRLSKYFLMTDCEVQLICQNWGNDSLFQNIHGKSRNKTWTAGGPTLSFYTDIMTNNADILWRTMRLSMTEYEVIRKETSGFRYYSWWTDLPWYNSDHFGTILRRMGADRNESYVSFLQQLHNQMSGNDWIFEHLVYQYWTLIQYGYQFDFIQCKCTCLENPTSCSTVNEGLHDLLNSTDKLCRQTVLDFVNTRPLWISCTVLNLWPTHWEQTFLFSFHHDRWCDSQWRKDPEK